MCGIVGLWQRQDHSVDLSALRSATTSLRHRGPDDEGYLLINTRSGRAWPFAGRDTLQDLGLPQLESVRGESGDLAFGFRRLSILDLSPAGHQPMASADGHCWIIFNGEIYNYLELRAELASSGYRFRTATDTEVILAAYQQWGHACLSRFVGMWAFAIWDQRLRRLFCARDRFGIKPFYYFWDGQIFAFASEIKALLALPGIPRQQNDPIIFDYLYEGRLDHTEQTFFAAIEQLLPAHHLDVHSRHVQVQRYWNLDPQQRAEPATREQYADRFYTLFEDSVRLHLRSDVPIGTCLSGGLDSSAIVCLANKILFANSEADPLVVGERQKTFSACFEDERYDERKYIKLVLAATGAEANFTFPNCQELSEALPRLLWHQEEPFVTTSIFAQWRGMAKAAERGVKVLLDGQGGDELLAGYPGYFSTFWDSLLRKNQWGELWREMLAYHRLHGISLMRAVLRLARLHAPESLVAAVDRSRHAKALGLNWEFLRQHQDRVVASPWQYDRDPFHGHLYAWLMRENLPQLLRYEDRNAMAFSIEARVPFLDHRLVEYVFALPADQKINRGASKAVLRRALHNIIPEPIRQRMDKMGFVTPEKTWLGQGLYDRMREIVESASFQSRSYFNAPQILEILDAHRAGQSMGTANIWRWVNLELWLRQMIDRAS